MHIHDCSNGPGRPLHRGGGGPKQNDVMRHLAEAAPQFGHSMVGTPSLADLVVTNDVFTDAALGAGAPRLKRMDGVFFQASLIERNKVLDHAAAQATAVVYISEFSKRSHETICGWAHPNHKVVLNRVDPQRFPWHPPRTQSPTVFLASATDWNRPEKRFSSLAALAQNFPTYTFIALGTPPQAASPANIVFPGYLSEAEMAPYFAQAHAMVCLAYRDAAPKTVAQGLASGLPVLFAKSGGVPELVGDFGVGFGPPDPLGVECEVPATDEEETTVAMETFVRGFSALSIPPGLMATLFHRMLADYFTFMQAQVSGTTP